MALRAVGNGRHYGGGNTVAYTKGFDDLGRGLPRLMPAQAADRRDALLGVDSESLTGANRLYESVGGSDMADAPMMFTFRLTPRSLP